jgi:hypothetical protein
MWDQTFKIKIVGILETLFGLAGLVVLLWFLFNYDSSETLAWLIIIAVPVSFLWAMALPLGVTTFGKQKLNPMIHIPVMAFSVLGAALILVLLFI